MIILTVKVTGSDPTDPTIALQRLAKLADSQKMAKLDFDTDEYEFECKVCETLILSNTKHCRQCNRCSYEFDHHCEWISNDIGLHNYIDYIRMLISVLTTQVIQMGTCIFFLFLISNEPTD